MKRKVCSRIIIAATALLCMFSVVYAINHDLFANTESAITNAGGSVTGRVNKNPSNLVVTNGGMQKGDKVSLGIMNADNTTDLGFQLLYNMVNYTKYEAVEGEGTYTFPDSTPISGWGCGATERYGEITRAFTDPLAFTSRPSISWGSLSGGGYKIPDYTDTTYSLIQPKMKELNLKIDALPNKDLLIQPRDMTKAAAYYRQSSAVVRETFNQVFASGEINQRAFLQTRFEHHNSGSGSVTKYTYGLPNKDYMFTEDYWLMMFASGSDISKPNAGYFVSKSSGSYAVIDSTVDGNEKAIRPFITLNPEHIVFAVSQGNASGIAKVDSSKLPSYSNIITATEHKDKMKLRLLDEELSTTTSFEQIQNASGTSISEANAGATIYLKANAKAGNDENGVNTVSALLFDQNKNFKYYRPLEKAKGEGAYALNLSGVDAGDYFIGIVNEVYNEQSIAPTFSSAITDVISFTVKESVPLSDFTFTPVEELTYSDNVNEGDVIGTVSTQNGVSPITYTLSANTEHAGDVNNFELVANESSSDGQIMNIQIVEGGPDVDTNTKSLKAGTYYFTISVLDGNNGPVDEQGNPAFAMDVTLVVAKKKATITFDENDKGTESISSSISEDKEFTQHATHTNKDILNAESGANDKDIVYTQNSGNSGIFNGLPYTAADGGVATLVAKKNQSGEIVLKAYIGETANYTEASTTKTLKAVLGLEASYVEDKTNIKAGSAAAKPSSTPIGHISASGGTTPYTYSPVTGENQNGNFTIDAAGKIFVASTVGNQGLVPGNYTIVVLVSDSATPAQTKEVSKTITIQDADLAGVSFENPDEAGSPVSTIVRTFDPSTTPAGGTFKTKLYETVTGSLTGTSIEYSVVSDPNDVIEYTGMTTPYANFKVKKASSTAELNQVKIKAHVTGGVYGESGKDIFIPVNVNPYEQKIEFAQGTSYSIENTSECVSVPATKLSDHWNLSDQNTITYTSGDQSKFTINSDGKVCPVADATGSATLTAKLAKDQNYKEATARITINVLGELSLSYAQTGTTKQAVNPNLSNDGGNAKDEAVFGKMIVAGGADQQYNIAIEPGDYAASYFTLVTTDNQRESTLKLNSGVTISAEVIKGGMNVGVIVQDEANPDQYNWTMNVQPNTDADTQSITIPIIGATPDLSFEQAVDNTITVTYAKDGVVDLSVKRGNQVLTNNISVNGNTGYQIFIDSLADRTTDTQLHSVGIKRANCGDNDQVLTGKTIQLSATANANDGYKSGSSSPTTLIIKKAEHPEVDFIEPDTILQSTVSSIDKGFTGIEPNDNHLTITPKDPETWEGTTFEKIDSGDATEPVVTIRPNGYEGSIIYVVNGGGTDNYKPIVNKEIDLFFSLTGGITYRPIKITYGDNAKSVIDYITDEDKENNTYTYAPVEGSSYVDENGDEVLRLDATTSTITTIKVGKTKVNVTRVDADNNILTQAIPVEVVAKEITLTYASNTIYTGETLPDISFLEPETGVLVGSDTIDDFTIPSSAAYYDGTEVISDSGIAGIYDIKGDWTQAELANHGNANYRVTLQAGQLTIEKDDVQENWYHLEDQFGNPIAEKEWYNHDVSVVLDTAQGEAGVYDQISNRHTFTNADKTKFILTEENENLEEIFFRINPDGDSEHKGAMTSTQAQINIDKKRPVIESITGYPVNDEGISEIINNLTFGIFFKPGVEVNIQTKDPQPAGESGRTVSGVQKVKYRIYVLDEQGRFDSTQTPRVEEGTVDANGEISFIINAVGNYRVCAIAEDKATNNSNESCSDLNIKLMDEDVDGDEELDFNDSDGDGCPDLNIVLGEDSEGNDVKLNVAEAGKKYPYMNIDSNGDGKADLNIDSDHDKKPDVNLVIMSEELWEPSICVLKEELSDYSKPVTYCTGTEAEAIINIDTTGNGVPNINIDNNGDMKADLNITVNGSEVQLNIVKIHEWNPNSDYSTQGFFYDSIGTGEDDPKRELNIDTNNDGYPDVNIDTDHNGVPDINIDDDGDEVPDWNIDGNGDGKPNINVDAVGNDGIPEGTIIDIPEWNPTTFVDGDVPYGTMQLEFNTELEDNGIVVEKPDGTFLPNSAIKVNDISDTVEDEVKDKINKVSGNQEIKKIYGVEYLENNVTKQPNGKVNVKIPVDPLIKNAKVVIEREDGSFEEVNVLEKDGFYIFETEYIGRVSILGDADKPTEPEPTPDPKPTTKPTPTPTPNTSVQGSYTPNDSGFGGANTGDTTNIVIYIGMVTFAFWMILLIVYRKYLKR